MGNLLEITGLCAGYGGNDAIRDVTFSVAPGEIFGIAGESGCGKSTVLKAVTGLSAGGARVTGGSAVFAGRDMTGLSAEERRRLLGDELCLVFQDPAAAMNPIRKIKRQFFETIRSHRSAGRAEAMDMISAAFRKLGLEDTKRILESCPYELSGGMCQRVALALATVMSPKLILADEPTSALDVTAQAQVADELARLREACGTAVVIVSHNIGLIAKLADRVAVMYGGASWKRAEGRRARRPEASLHPGAHRRRTEAGGG
jgi:peptide/nickel transport system ATP-binding protein